MRCQGIFTFDNTRARAGHRASSRAFSRWGEFSATVSASPRVFFPIECVCRLKNIFLFIGSCVGSYSLGNWTLLLSVFPGWDCSGAPRGRSGKPLQPEHAQEGSNLEGTEEPPTTIDAQGANGPSPPIVGEQPYDSRPEGERE